MIHLFVQNTQEYNGWLWQIHNFSKILKERKKVLRKKTPAASGPSDEELAQITQLVIKGEYRGKERPFAENAIWAKHLCPTGHCSVCGQYYNRPAFVQRHMQLVHYFSWFQCPVCLLWKTRVQDLASHIKEEHPANEGLLLDCIECGKQFPLSTLLSHVQSCLKQKLPDWTTVK